MRRPLALLASTSVMRCTAPRSSSFSTAASSRCHAVERRLVELALRVGLLGLALGPVEVAHHLGNRDEVAGVDLCLIFLGATAPHRPLDAGLALQGFHGALDGGFLGKLAHAHALRLAGGHAQGHLVLLEGDDEQLERQAGDLLLFDADDAADAMRGIDDPFAGLEAVTLVYGLHWLLGSGLLPGKGRLLGKRLGCRWRGNGLPARLVHGRWHGARGGWHAGTRNDHARAPRGGASNLREHRPRNRFGRGWRGNRLCGGLYCSLYRSGGHDGRLLDQVHGGGWLFGENWLADGLYRRLGRGLWGRRLVRYCLCSNLSAAHWLLRWRLLGSRLLGRTLARGLVPCHVSCLTATGDCGYVFHY